MLAVARPLLKPVLSVWCSIVSSRLAFVPRPADAPQAHAGGENPDRVLLLGNGPAAGWGVRSHDLALPGQLARQLSARTRRGTDVDLVADPALRITSALRAAEGRNLAGYDAFVMMVGVEDALALVSPSRWRTSMRNLIDTLLERASPSARILVVGIQPIRSIPPFSGRLGAVADRHARALNRVTEQLCAGDPRVSYFRLPAAESTEADRHRGPRTYREWASQLTGQLVPLLEAATLPCPTVREARAEASARAFRNQRQDDDDRYRALDTMRILDTESNDRIDRIVSTARSLFGMTGAAFTLVDRQRQWNMSRIGFDVEEVPLEESICAFTIREPTALILADARQDPRFGPASNIGFYAGYPVESPDGQRIGALCVFDQEARDPNTINESALRNLALALQREVWELTLRRRPPVAERRFLKHAGIRLAA